MAFVRWCFYNSSGNDVYALALIVGCRQGSPDRSTADGKKKVPFLVRNYYVERGVIITSSFVSYIECDNFEFFVCNQVIMETGERYFTALMTHIT